MSIFKKDYKVWIPVVLWMLLIFSLSSIPSIPGPGSNWLDFFFKKSAHVFVYCVLYFLFSRTLKTNSNQNLFIIYGIVILYAISDEVHQSFVPGRTPNIMDVGFDSIGMSIAFARIKELI